MTKAAAARALYFVATVLLFAAVFLLLLSTNMQKELSHDEHMYIAGGALIARDGLLPYRDFHYLQMPYLAFVYAALFRFSDQLLLTARLFNTLCATLSLCVVYFITSGLLREVGYVSRFLLGAGSVLLVLSSPIFFYASGLAWNHDLPLFFLLLAVALFGSSAGKSRLAFRLFLVGMLVGCAAGTRLSFALTVVPFALGTFFLPGVTRWRDKFLLSGMLLLGVFAGLTPALLLFALAPDNFMFDNLRYHALNETYWQQQRYTRAMDLPGKLAYLSQVVIEQATLPMFISWLLALPVAVWAVRKRRRGYFVFAFTLSVVPFLLVGALGPTPTWFQYFYVLVPFFVLGIAHAVASLYALDGKWKWVLLPFAALVVVCASFAAQGYGTLNKSLSPDNWVSVKVHMAGLDIKVHMGDGRVLTLSPLLPLEGNLDIRRELATGPFMWRLASLLPFEDKRELDGLLEHEPPEAIITGLEPGLDDPLIVYAQQHGYRPLTLSNGMTLWADAR